MIEKDLVEQIIKDCPYEIIYLTRMGSHAYGCASETSDFDYYGACVPSRQIVYSDRIIGYDEIQKFEQWEKKYPDYNSEVSIYNITKYFKLLQDANPNIIDSLYTDNSDVIINTELGKQIKGSRRLFLSDLCYKKFKCYADSQLKSIRNPKEKSKRASGIKELGYDRKDAYNVIRLLTECIQIFRYEDINLKWRAFLLRDIKKGKITYEEFLTVYNVYSEILEIVKKSLGNVDKNKIRNLLVKILNEYYNKSSN